LKYINAKDVLPPDILIEVQKYTGGELLYIPKKDKKAGWGQVNGTRKQVLLRNSGIIDDYRQGRSVYELMEQYCLSEASIRKIVYSKI